MFCVSAGSEPAANEDLLDIMCITHIVNMTTNFENQFPKKYKYHRIKEEDLEDVNLMNYFENTFKFIDQGREDGKVLVHCNSGMSRSGTIVVAYVMRSEGMRHDEAMEFAQSKRNNPIYPNEGFLEQLRQYEEILIKNVVK